MVEASDSEASSVGSDDDDGDSVLSSDEEGKKPDARLSPEEARKAAAEAAKKELEEKQSVQIKEGDYQIQVHLIEVGGCVGALFCSTTTTGP